MVGKKALVHCPHCKALYQVVKVEAPEAADQQISTGRATKSLRVANGDMS